MDALPATPEEKALFQFMLTAIYTGLILHRSGGLPGDAFVSGSLSEPQRAVLIAEEAATEVLNRLPSK